MNLQSIQTAKDWINSQTPTGVIDPTKTPIPPVQLLPGWNLIGNVSQYTWHMQKSIELVWNGALNVYTTDDVFQQIKNVDGIFWSRAAALSGICPPGMGVNCYFESPHQFSPNNSVYFHPQINPGLKQLADANVTLNFQRTGYVSGIEVQLQPGWNIIAYTGNEIVPTNAVSNVLQNALLLSSPSDSFIPVDVEGGNIIDIIAGQAYGTSADTEVNNFYDNIENEYLNPDLELLIQQIKDVTGAFWTPEASILNFQLRPGSAYQIYIKPSGLPAGSTLTINFQRNA